MFDILIRDVEKESYMKLNGNVLEGFSIVGRNITNITEEELTILQVLKLSKNAVYLGKINDFDTYLDNNSGLRHFLKDNVENIKMFCEYNAINIGRYKKEEPLDDFQDSNSTFLVRLRKIQRRVEIIASVSVLTLLLAQTLTLGFSNASQNMTCGQDGYETIVRLVEENSRLNEEEKHLFTNEKLLNDILPFYEESTKNKIVNVSFKLLDVRYYEKKQHNRKILGYYNHLWPGYINIQKGLSPEEEYDTKCHEFCHLLEAHRYYQYIMESCAEIVSYEYYDCPIDFYKGGVKNVKTLMEIIGPSTIWKLLYSDVEEEFVNILNQNLPKEKAEKLLKLFTLRPGSTKTIDNEVESLLKDLYYSINKVDIEENVYIKNMENIAYRYYFNSEKILKNNPKLVKRDAGIPYEELLQLFAKNPNITDDLTIEIVDNHWKEKAASIKEALKLGYIKIYYDKDDLTLEQIITIIEEGSSSNYSIVELPNIYETFPEEENKLLPKKY